MTATGLTCGSCGAELRAGDKFCHECAAPVVAAAKPAEYKQVTVLFADVVRSMAIAAAVDMERLREIMTELVERSVAMVQRYGGTVEFTGDGVMALFGAPVALEDHAFRACLAALAIQDETNRLAAEVQRRDGVALRLRVGLNSGRVIAGEIGSGALGYTAIGEQVGMAQRMESVAPPGGVMLSESTARLVEGAAVLGDSEVVHVKGIEDAVPARRLLSMAAQRQRTGPVESTLVGREGELAALAATLDRSVGGHGSVVGVVGSPGIGKTRLAREAVGLATRRGVEVFSTFCESHATDVPFRVVARLLRAVGQLSGLDHQTARARVRSQILDADPRDMLLLDDLLGIADPEVELPKIDPDARRRRLTALINAAQLARTQPAVFVIEDVHWIDAVSESMLADFLAVIPQTHSMVLITYRPEYHGALQHVAGARTVALAPLSDSETSTLVAELLGRDPSVRDVANVIAGHAAGNPFFAEEIVRELAERGVLRGEPGAYLSRAEIGEIGVPATLQATIAARIDRLGRQAKRTLSAAAVIGSRFSSDLLASLGIDPSVDKLITADLIDQVRFTPRAEYAFRHPLIRTVAYQSQLKSDRAQLHRRLATTIEAREPESADQNAALIAEHLEAAGELRAAFDWHMRAGTWSNFRDIAAAQSSWRRARQVADRLPEDDPERMSMRIAPRTLLCGTAWRVGGGGAETGFDELRELCTATGDQVSLAIGMAGLLQAHYMNAHRREASRLASELSRLLESIADATLTVALSFTAMSAKQETCEMAAVLCLAQRAIDLADGDPAKGNLVFPSPLTFAIGMRGVARWCLGIAGWKNDFHEAMAMARERAGDPTILAGVMWFTYPHAIPYGVLLPDATAARDTAEFLAMAEQFGDDLALEIARLVRGIVLVDQDGPQREAGLDLLERARERALNQRFALLAVPVVDIQIAREKARLGDVDGAIGVGRTVAEELFDSGTCIWSALAITVLVEALVHRGGDEDLKDARAAIDRLAAVPTDPGFVLHEICLLRLRALLARAHGDAANYAQLRDRYRDMARTLGFEGHMQWAEAMP
jgi:adenylate cyclase